MCTVRICGWLHLSGCPDIWMSGYPDVRTYPDMSGHVRSNTCSNSSNTRSNTAVCQVLERSCPDISVPTPVPTVPTPVPTPLSVRCWNVPTPKSLFQHLPLTPFFCSNVGTEAARTCTIHPPPTPPRRPFVRHEAGLLSPNEGRLAAVNKQQPRPHAGQASRLAWGELTR